jgi:hypothetical protein
MYHPRRDLHEVIEWDLGAHFVMIILLWFMGQLKMKSKTISFQILHSCVINAMGVQSLAVILISSEIAVRKINHAPYLDGVMYLIPI